MLTFKIRTPRGTTGPLTRVDGRIICESGDAIFEEIHAMLVAERQDTRATNVTFHYGTLGSSLTSVRRRLAKQYALATIGLSDAERF